MKRRHELWIAVLALLFTMQVGLAAEPSTIVLSVEGMT
jgi:hypothetical protein